MWVSFKVIYLLETFLLFTIAFAALIFAKLAAQREHQLKHRKLNHDAR